MRLKLVLALSLIASSALAQMGEPGPINVPIAEEWRAPFERFLREFRLDDPEALVSKTFALKLRGIRHPDAILFRIEDPSTCAGEVCLTVIGHIVGDRLQVDAMFNAGNRITTFDSARQVLGVPALPKLIYGDKTVVELWDMPPGWLVIFHTDTK